MSECFVKRRSLIVLAALWLLLLLQAAGAAASSPGADEVRGVLGLYESGGQSVLVRENDGRLELLFGAGGIMFDNPQTYKAFQLEKTGRHSYRLLSSQYASPHEKVTISVDPNGHGTNLTIDGQGYIRKFFGPELGQGFRIQPLMSATELRRLAQNAEPPGEEGPFLTPDLVDIVVLDGSVLLDIRYATEDNFMGMALYDQPRALLQRPAAEALVRAHHKLKQYGYGLIIHDAYRPWRVTKMFWDATPADMKVFVADPAKGSRHNRGGAVDVALYDQSTGKAINMISGYDEFSLRAYSGFAGGTTMERYQRDLLRAVMEGEGFTVYPEEWWHFDYQDWRKYPIMNTAFSEIP